MTPDIAVRFPAAPLPPHQLSLILHHHGNQPARNSYDLNRVDASDTGLFHRLNHRVADWSLR